MSFQIKVPCLFYILCLFVLFGMTTAGCENADECEDTFQNLFLAWQQYSEAETAYFWNQTPENCQQLKNRAGAFLAQLDSVLECSNSQMRDDRMTAEGYSEDLEC